jgi:alkylhydroperoxidase family enzyme
MSAVAAMPSTLDRLGELHPEGAVALRRMIEHAWRATDPALLALCRRRVLEVLGTAGPPEGPFTPVEEAHLELTEQFARAVSGVTDEQIAALRGHGDDRSVYSFVAALYVVDMSERLELLARATFAHVDGDSGPAGAGAPTRVPAPQSCALDAGPRVVVPGGGMSMGTPLDEAMDAFAAAAMRSQTVDAFTTEVVRQRCARIHDCRTCGSLRSPAAQAAGLDEAAVELIASGDGADLGGRAGAALRLADSMIVDPAGIGTGLYEELRPWLSDEEIAELALDVVKWSKQKFLVALRLETPPWDGNALLTFDEHGEPVIAF